MLKLDENYKKWATDTQWECYKAYCEQGTIRKAAEVIGIKHQNVHTYIAAMKRKAEMHGYSPEHDLKHPVPDSMLIEKMTIQRDGDGKLQRYWAKTVTNAKTLEDNIHLLVEGILQGVQGIPEIPDVLHEAVNHDVIPWIQIGDAHLGMLAYKAEVGKNFDLKIAVKDLCMAFSMFIDELGYCERLVINDLGDFTHYENLIGVTERSGHKLDCDNRYSKMITVYGNLMRFMVDKCLEKANYVDVIINQGNHSEKNDLWMAATLRQMYQNNSRVWVADNRKVFIPYRMGNVLCVSHHGHKCKADRMPQVIATDFSKHFGECGYVYADMGHIHTKTLAKEYGKVTVESWNNLATMDGYAHDHGWRSKPSINAVFRSKRYGEVGRRTLPLAEVRDRLELSGLDFTKVYSDLPISEEIRIV